MGAITQLIEQAGSIVQRRLDATIYEWMRQVSTIVDNLSGGTQAQVRYVNKAGNDTTGDGSFDNPFLTIQAAITSITDAAAAKVYYINVAAGDYSEVFTLKPFVYVVGESPKVTRLSPVQANWIGTGFAAAGVQETGLMSCSVGTALAVNFAAGGIASPGAGGFFLDDVYWESTLTITGNNALNNYFISNSPESLGAFGATSFTNIGGTFSGVGFINDAVTFTQNAAYIVAHTLSNVGCGGAFTVSCASTTNRCIVQAYNLNLTSATAITLTGDGAVLTALSVPMRVVGPDANTTFSFLTASAGSVKLIDGGENFIQITATTAERTYTINTPTFSGTRVRIKNQTANAVPLTFVATFTGGLSYIPPFSYVDMWFSNGNWCMNTPAQSGVVTLTNGVSAAIPADIAAGSFIVATLKTFNGATGIIQAKGTDRVNGTRAGGGSFKLTSVTQAAGATVATDQGTYDWHIVP